MKPLRSTVAAAALLAAGLVPYAPHASADTSASTTLTVTANPVRSVTVDTTSLALNTCQWSEPGSGVGIGTNTLYFPNGRCTSTTGVTITNGGAASHLQVAATNATPTDHGTPWTLCSCITPGTDQYRLSTGLGSDVIASNITPIPSCDATFAPLNNGNCQLAPPLAHKTEFVTLTGPTSSSDLSTRWTFTITWTAAP